MNRGGSAKRSVRLALIAGLLVALLVAGSLSAYAWTYQYDSVNDIGIWSKNGIDRFKYQYTAQRWWDNSQYGGWAPIGPVGWCPVAVIEANPANFIGNGAWQSQGNGWSYLYSAAGDYGTWHYNGLHRFLYNYTPGQWYDHSSSNATYWSALGGVNTGSLFIGDGVWHDMRNSWAYLYSAAGDYGTWHIGGFHRFLYNYTAGQWYDHASSNGATYWNALGGASVRSVFIGDGAWHDVNNNGWNYQYYPGDYGTWHRGGLLRFLYHYTTGQWSDHASSNAIYWNTVGGAGLSSAFIADGSWHTVATDWSYQYDTSDDFGAWQDNGQLRFGYQYLSGQWWDKGSCGDWATLGVAGLSSTFLGDGAVHTLDTNWTYQFTGGLGYWTNTGSGLTLFSYDYATGQWKDQGNTGGWKVLSPTGFSALFIGNGNPHTFDSTWSYTFSETTGTWRSASLGRDLFKYNYSTGQWQNQGSDLTWQNLGPTGLSAAFLGDGSPHTLDSTWSYTFSGTTGTWNYSTLGRGLFAYNYGDGQWLNQGVTGGLQTLSYTPMSAAFIGDGTTYDIGATVNGVSWQYQFDGTNGKWTNPGLGLVQFAYNYADGQWLDQGVTGGLQTLSYTPMSAAFIGDSTIYDIGATVNEVSWQYQFDGTNGKWTKLGQYRFAYDYTYSEWLQWGGISWGQLSASGVSADFIGDGATHNIGAFTAPWYFTYDAGTGSTDDRSLFSRSATGDNRFTFSFADSQWFDYDLSASSWVVLGNSGASPVFIGDGSAHSLGTWNAPGSGSWWFTYNAGTGPSNDQGQFSLLSSGGNRFAYGYNMGQWFQYDGYGSPWVALGASGASLASFIGDGSSHNLGIWYQPSTGHWYFAYNAGSGSTNDKGQFSLDGTSSTNRFTYGYNSGQWEFYEQNGIWKSIGGASQSLASFIGDGGAHTLYTGGTWALRYDSANHRLVINQTAQGWEYLAYSFAGAYWMDGGYGYPLAEITGGSSPYWLSSADAGSLTFTSPSSGQRMWVNLYESAFWMVSYDQTYMYRSEYAYWYNKPPGYGWCWIGSGGPGDHRQ